MSEPAPGTEARQAGRILFVGSDHPQKRASLLTHLVEALPRARLVLVGRFASGFLQRFEGFGERVLVRGVLDPGALAAEYRAASVVAHPAVGEAFGLVPFEAALSGTPAVVAAGHGCGEWFARAGGCVVPPDDAPALREAVAARLDDPVRGGEEAGRVAEFTRRELTWQAAAERLETLYRKLAASTPAPA